MSPESSRIPRIAIAVGAVVVVVAGVGGLLAINGGDDDGGPDGNGRRTTTTEPTTTTTTTEPAAVGDDQELAFSLVEELALEATALSDELVQNPQAVNDPNNPDIARLTELYTPDSPTPSGLTNNLHQLADQGQRIQASPVSGVFREMKVFEMTALDENTVRFRFCAGQDQETVDASGAVVNQHAELAQGTGEARRIDGFWRFFGLHRDDASSIPLEPGQVTPGLCDSLYPDGEATS